MNTSKRAITHHTILTARHLRLALAALDWDQQELADRSGVSRATIRRALKGHGMRPATVNMLIVVFDKEGVCFLQADEGHGEGVRMRLEDA